MPVNLIIMTIWKNKREKEIRKRLMEGEYHMAFDKNKMRAVLIQREGEQIAGFRERQSGVFHAMMRIQSGVDVDLFMETYNLTVVNIE